MDGRTCQTCLLSERVLLRFDRLPHNTTLSSHFTHFSLGSPSFLCKYINKVKKYSMHSSPRPAKDLPPLPPASPSTFATTTAAEAAAAPSPGPRPPLPPRRTPSSSEESASILSSAVDWPLPYEQPTTAAMASTAPLPPPIDATPGTTSTTPSMVRAYDPHFDPNMQSDGEDLDVTAAMHLPIIDALLTRKLPTLPSADSSSSLSTVGTAQPATLLPPIPGSPLVPASATAPAADLELDLAAEVEALLHVADDVGAEDGEVVHPIGMVTEDDNGPQEDPEAVAVATAMLDHTLGRRHTLRRERSVRRAAGSVGGGGGGRPASAVTLTSPPAPSAVVLGDSPSPPSPFVSASPPTPAATTEKATIPTLASIASSSHATDSLASLSPGALTTADRQAPPAEGRVLSEYERGHSPVVHAAPLADDSPRQHQQHERAESSSGMAVMAAMSVGAGLGGGDDMYQRALNLLEMKRIAVLGDVDATVSPTKQSTYAPASMGGGEAYYGEYNNNDDDQQEMTVEFAPAGGPTDLESPPLQYSSLGADGAPAAVASAPAADHVDGVHKVHNQDLATTPETPVVVAGSDRSIVSSLIPPAPSKTPDIDDSQRVMFMQAIDVLRMLTSPTAQPSSQSQLEQQFGAPQSAIQPAAAEPQYAVTSAPTAAVPTSFDNLPSLPEAPPVTNAAADAEAAVASLPEIPEAPPVLSSHEDLVVVPVAEDQPAVAVPIHEFTDLPDDGEEMMLPMSSSSPNAATPVAAVAKPAMMNPTSPTDTALGAADATSIAAAAQPLPEMRAFRPVVVSQAPIGAQKTGGDALPQSCPLSRRTTWATRRAWHRACP
ncbi:hypothetical protein BC828DRAFT_238402 [Blastocladiella britannica]|nr:hypothetical protein BC828DRAFT_238402 [Blastocladiella britannica]